LPSELPDWQGFTLEEYARLKGLERLLLKHLFAASVVTRRGKPVVAWQYSDWDGKPLAIKLRLSANSHDTYFEPADPHVPYGLNNPSLKNMIAGTYDLILAEGETDTHTFASWGLPVIGISGAEGWFPEYAEEPVVANARRVFISEHADSGGKKFKDKILKTLPQALVLRLPAKDANELHMANPPDFTSEDAMFGRMPFIQHVDIAIQAATLEKVMQRPKTRKAKPQPMREEAFYGLAGRAVELLEPYLEADRAAILTSFLGTVGLLFQREAYCKVVADYHYPVDYYLTVGTSAIARKGNATNAVLELLEKVQPGFKSKIIHGLSTGQGLVKTLIKKKPEDQEDSTEDGNAPAEAIAPAVLIEISEFSELLAVMKRDENTLSAVVRDAWDGKPLAVTTRVDPLKVHNVSLATIAHITASELTKKLTSTDRANGFANRFLFVYSERAKLLPRGDSLNLDASEVIAGIRAAVNKAQGRGLVRRDEATEEIWAEEYKRLTTRGDSMVDTILNRADAHTLRLSLLYALLDGSPVIDRDHLRAALAFWDYAEESVRYIFGNSVAPEDEKILDSLKDGPLTIGEIRRRAFGDNKPSEWVAEKLMALVEQRMVRPCVKEYKTKTIEAYELNG
jgi:hypothetical protein